MTVLFFYGSSIYNFKNPAHTRRFQMAESSLDECLQQNSHYSRTVGFIYIGIPNCMIIINQYLNRLTEIAFCAYYRTISTMFYMVVWYIRIIVNTWMTTYNVLQEWQSCIYNNHISYIHRDVTI